MNIIKSATKLFAIPALWAAATISFAAYAGVVNGGGGRGVVCRQPDKAITSAVLLDLFEAEAQYGLQLAQVTGTFDDALEAAALKLESLSSGMRDSFYPNTQALRDTFKKFRFLPKGVGLNLVDDSYDALIPAGCEVEQLAFYKEPELILVNGDIWEKLDVRSRVALVLHEAIYQDFRMGGATDSRDARKVVSYLFSTVPLDNIADGIPRDGEAIRCMAQDSSDFYIRRECASGACQTLMQFTRLGGHRVFSKTIVRAAEEIYLWLTGATLPGTQETVYASFGKAQSAIPERTIAHASLQLKGAKPFSNEFVEARLGLFAMDQTPRQNDEHYLRLNCVRETRDFHGLVWKSLKQ